MTGSVLLDHEAQLALACAQLSLGLSSFVEIPFPVVLNELSFGGSALGCPFRGSATGCRAITCGAFCDAALCRAPFAGTAHAGCALGSGAFRFCALTRRRFTR